MLTIQDIKYKAPSVFATEAWNQTSDKYRFVPTIEVVNALMEKGFVPMTAVQGRCRIEGKTEYTRHVLRFRHADFAGLNNRADLLGVPEIVLMNSHDRSSAYKIMMGIFRQVCSNGLIACLDDVGFTVRHSGSKDLTQQVIDASFEVIENAPKVAAKVEQWSNIILNPKQQLALASAALELRTSPIKVEPEQLLNARRTIEYKKPNGDRDLYTTYNVVQENMIKGGRYGKSEKTGKITKMRAVNNIGDDIKLNKALWRLTEELAKVA